MRYSNALEHVVKGYSGLKNLVTNFKVVQIPQNVFSRKVEKLL